MSRTTGGRSSLPGLIPLIACVLLAGSSALQADESTDQASDSGRERDHIARSSLLDWFRNDEQRAAAKLAADDVDAVIEAAPDAHWEAIARYRQGDHAGAADAYSRAVDAFVDANGESEDSVAERTRRDDLQVAQATAATRAGQLDEALALFDRVLSHDPDNQDALHNRDIARQLKALEQQGGDQGEGEAGEQGGDPGEGERSESGEPGESAEPSAGDDGASSDDEQSDAEDGEQEGSSGERDADSEAPDQSEQAGATQNGESGQGEPAAGTEEEQAAAQAALAAEAERDRQADDLDNAARVVSDEGEPPTEQEQATEQWMRRIADDPSGLLRRRVEQSHRNDYPEVRDSDQPW